MADRHERPYRQVLNQRIAEDLRRHPALVHVMIHTDPTTDGLILLETPIGADFAEKFASAWRMRLAAAELDIRQVRGAEMSPLGTALSKAFPPDKYAQVRLTVSQTFFLEGRPQRWETVKKTLLDSLVRVAGEVLVVSDLESPSTVPR